MWPYVEDDHMEIGNTGWICVGEGLYKNLNTGHTIDEMGIEYDENGQKVYPVEENKEDE
jgi:hypothetical protein